MSRIGLFMGETAPWIKISTACTDSREMAPRFTRTAHRRLTDEQSGFTLLELLIVLVVVAVLLTIAVPSVLGYRERAENAVAASNIRTAEPAVLAYFSDHGTFAGMTVKALREIDAGLDLDPLVPVMQTATTYCIATTVGSTTWRSSSDDLADAVEGSCLPATARVCHHDGWRKLGPNPTEPFTSEERCVDFALAGGTPVAASAR